MSATIEFGTDGIRGPVGLPPLDTPSLEHIAQGIAAFLGTNAHLAIAQDTRASGRELINTLSHTFTQYGIHVHECGILPTAALACVVVDHQFDLGIVITASHNPASDNGIKLFNAQGMKLSEDEQQRLEQAFSITPKPAQGTITTLIDASKSWRSRLPNIDLTGWTVLLDCAHGALSPYGKTILEDMGAVVIERASTPDGYNINDNVGALHPPDDLCGADLALCFDGDADRLAIVTNAGLIDGDDFLWLLKDCINGPLVGTVMSNGGLDTALDGRLIRANVGDKHVLAEMHAAGALLGAEPSGHVIFLDGEMPAGDGLYAALRILQAVGKPPIRIGWSRWPTHQQSIRFSNNIPKPALNDWISIQEAKETGHRLVVRYSGTEPKLRILVEGPDCDYWSNAIAAEFTSKLKP